MLSFLVVLCMNISLPRKTALEPAIELTPFEKLLKKQQELKNQLNNLNQDRSMREELIKEMNAEADRISDEIYDELMRSKSID